MELKRSHLFRSSVNAWRGFLPAVLVLVLSTVSFGQMENLPVSNQLYEFLDRMGVKGILPLYSNAMIPLSRAEIAGYLQTIDARRSELSDAEIGFLRKFQRELAHELGSGTEGATSLFSDGITSDLWSDKEKYLYAYADSDVTAYVEFLGSLEYRGSSGDSYGSSHATLEQHGGRIRGTIKEKLGYFLQATNGTLWGDRAFALSDPRLRANVKFKDLNTPYFDFTEAYVRADLSWFNFEYGREYTLVGTGYSDRLLLSENAPAFDFLKLDAHYKSIRYEFLHASILSDSSLFPGLLVQEPPGSNKYMALHRLQMSLFDRLNIGASEMTVYQRFSPEFAYLNPVIFFKSVEHSLHDRDNSFLSFDLEWFIRGGAKIYGTWLIDDIDFSKMGTGWWGNEFAWQGGATAADVAGLPNLDATIEYTRIEPYVYSNRVAGNDYSHNNVGLGHHLAPNSDEWFVQLAYRPSAKLRAWATYRRERHGTNILDATGQVVRNVGGDVLQGHRGIDAETATFLDGNVVQTDRFGWRVAFEPMANFMFILEYERRSIDHAVSDNLFALRGTLEY